MLPNLERECFFLFEAEQTSDCPPLPFLSTDSAEQEVLLFTVNGGAEHVCHKEASNRAVSFSL